MLVHIVGDRLVALVEPSFVVRNTLEVHTVDDNQPLAFALEQP